jgi:DNA repair exonuclease SbcCD ATPase subunit
MTGENAGELLTGLTREVFDRSVFLRQSGLAVGQSQELERRLTALVSSGEEETSWSEADSCLKGWQRRRRFHQTGLIPQLEQEEEALRQTQTQTHALRQELAQLQTRAAGLRRQKAHWDQRLASEGKEEQADLRRRREDAAQELAAAEDQVRALQAQGEPQEEPDWEEERDEIQDDLRSRRRLMTGFVILVVVLSAVAGLLYVVPTYLTPLGVQFPLTLPHVPGLFLGIAVGLLWALVIIFAVLKGIYDWRAKRELKALYARREDPRQSRAPRARTLEEALIQRDRAKRYYDALTQQRGPYVPPEAEACREALHAVERELAQVQGQLSALGDPILVDAQLDQVQEKRQALQEDYDALDIALEALKEADDQLHARLSPQLSRRAGEYFSGLTQGRYTGVSLTRDLEVTVREGDSLTEQPLAYLSQGTADQLYLALRLAVAETVLPPGQTCPLILDDALVSFDDDRLALALDLLADLAKDRQILLFTCQQREEALLQGRETVTLGSW